MFNFSSSGPLMEEAGDPGGGGTDIVIADGIGDVNIDSTSDDAAAVDTVDTADTTVTPAEEEPVTGKELVPFTGRAIQDGKINPAAKPFLDELRTKSPAFEKQVRNALIRQDVLNREFPGGVPTVRAKIAELEAIINEIGGQDGVRSTREELAFFHDIDQQFTAGDPRFIEALIADPAGQAAFIKLAPSMIERYAALHPEGFEAFLHGKMKAELERSGVNLSLLRMQDFIERLPADSPERAGIVREWGNLVGAADGSSGFYNRIIAGAARKVEPPKPETTAPRVDDSREQQLSQREQRIKDTEFQGEWNSALHSAFNTNWQQLTKDRQLDDVQEANAKELFSGILKRYIASDQQTQANLSKLYKSGDRTGYQRAVKALFAKEIPRALTAALDRAAPVRAKKNVVTPPGGNNGKTPTPPALPATPVRTIPTADQIDMIKTDRDKYITPDENGFCHAVLKTGAKVKFKR